MRGNIHAPRKRTQLDMVNDCVAFICNARPAALLAMTADRLCDERDVKNAGARRQVEAKLLAAQERERRRGT